MSIIHGSCCVNDEINIKYHQHNFEKILKNNNGKVTGANDLNRFCKIDNINQIQLTNCANSIVGKKLDWNWEYFHSGEPAGLHTDYERRYYDTDYNDTIVGIIIPLNCAGGRSKSMLVLIAISISRSDNAPKVALLITLIPSLFCIPLSNDV